MSPTEIYAVGDSATVDRAAYLFNGTAWREIGRTPYSQSLQVQIKPWADPRGGRLYLL